MSQDHLTPEARHENALMLAAALGLDIGAAGEALKFAVSVSADPTDKTAITVANEFAKIFERTIESVQVNSGYDAAILELVVGNANPKSDCKKLFVSVTPERAVISKDKAEEDCASVPSILTVLIACYSCAAVLGEIFSENLPFNVPSPLIVAFDQLGVDLDAMSGPVKLSKAYLAGAGAIGNAFLWAARHLDIHGDLIIADDDAVSSGNLNRQIWFSALDIQKPKAKRLALAAQSSFPSLNLTPSPHRLQDLAEEGPWLKRLIVAVDSRRARRKIQNEFPGEVFDASTTDIQEVVVHYHKQPTAAACMSCIYESDEEEHSREAHIAEQLGVTVAEVKQERISPSAAATIAGRYLKLVAENLVGLAYDSLFKELCGQRELKTLEGRRVVAPFAFVSVLAGTLLALEVVRRLGSGTSRTDFNYWRVSPWYPPIIRRQALRPKQPDCEFCGNSILAEINVSLWKHTDLEAPNLVNLSQRP